MLVMAGFSCVCVQFASVVALVMEQPRRWTGVAWPFEVEDWLNI